MSNITKQLLADTLEQLLAHKPLAKITVKDVVESAHVNRQTFYYHFRDLFDLVGWIFSFEAERIIADGTLQTWQQSLVEAFSCMVRHRALILNVFNSPNRDDLYQFLHHVSHPLFVNLVARSQRSQKASPEDCDLIAWFYTYALTGLVLDWIRTGMKGTPTDLVVQIARLVAGDLSFHLDLGE